MSHDLFSQHSKFINSHVILSCPIFAAAGKFNDSAKHEYKVGGVVVDLPAAHVVDGACK